ncbi:hypothetical protein GCM10009414_17500 [Tatumella terrea]|uniref:hypothetical protein n=1 Tax=Tatumella terrea TaxID=419007 RepID=UPI0031D03049
MPSEGCLQGDSAICLAGGVPGGITQAGNPINAIVHPDSVLYLRDEIANPIRGRFSMREISRFTFLSKIEVRNV